MRDLFKPAAIRIALRSILRRKVRMLLIGSLVTIGFRPRTWPPAIPDYSDYDPIPDDPDLSFTPDEIAACHPEQAEDEAYQDVSRSVSTPCDTQTTPSKPYTPH